MDQTHWTSIKYLSTPTRSHVKPRERSAGEKAGKGEEGGEGLHEKPRGRSVDKKARKGEEGGEGLGCP